MSGGLVLVGREQFRRSLVESALDEAGLEWALLEEPGARADQLLERAVALVVPPERILSEDEVGRARELRAVVSPVIGTNHLPLKALAHRGVPVAHGAAPENYVGMAEAAVGLMLSIVHHLKVKEANLLNREARLTDVGGLLSTRTIGLVGLGRIGRAVAERLTAFGCRLVGSDPQVDEVHGVEVLPLAELLRVSDVISIQVPLTDDSRALLDTAAFQTVKPGAFVVNIGRGGVVDEVALAEALDRGHVAGAAIDVWADEPPPPDHPLLGRTDVIATLHNAGHSNEAYDRLARLSVEQVTRLLAGREAVYPVG
ncbi:NAD(P)-dependent oxidoreductase [Georgenia sp. Z1344]|uniref:NAD(P)-dependent oxidoreductase n=1 Tax=Georgenia sp. Z1344 TaxID=3416706 RepID=UPI003CE6E0BD